MSVCVGGEKPVAVVPPGRLEPEPEVAVAGGIMVMDAKQEEKGGRIMATDTEQEEKGGGIMATDTEQEEKGGGIMVTDTEQEEKGGGIMATDAEQEEKGGIPAAATSKGFYPQGRVRVPLTRCVP